MEEKSNPVESLVKQYVFEYLDDLKKILWKYLEPVWEFLKPEED